MKLKAFKSMILVDFGQLKKNSGQKFDNSLHSNALFLIFIFTFEIKTFFLNLYVKVEIFLEQREVAFLSPRKI